MHIADYERDAKSGNGSFYRELNDNWNTLAPIICMYERDTPRSNYISKELRQYYFNDQPINSATRDQLAKVCTMISPPNTYPYFQTKMLKVN